LIETKRDSFPPPEKFHLPVFDIHDLMIGNSNSVGLATDVVHYLLRASERWLGVDHPFLREHRGQITGKSRWVVKCLQRREEAQLASVEGLLQISQKQTAEQTG
jgi:hypothetical protein